MHTDENRNKWYNWISRFLYFDIFFGHTIRLKDIADKIDNIVEGGDNGEVEGSENVEAPSGKGGILSGMINATSEAEPNQMVAVGTKMEEQTSQEARWHII